MANSLDELAKADLQAHSVMEQVAAVQDPALAKQLATSSAALKTILEGTGPNATKRLPGIDEVTAEATLLYGELEQADANPTAALLAAASHVQKEGTEVLPGMGTIQANTIAADESADQKCSSSRNQSRPQAHEYASSREMRIEEGSPPLRPRRIISTRTAQLQSDLCVHRIKARGWPGSTHVHGGVRPST